MNYSLIVFTLICLSNFTVHAQNIIFGEVVDQDGEELAWATVSVVGTTIGTSTDFDGTFQIKVDQIPATLEFTFLGYQAKTLMVTDPGHKVKVQLEVEPSSLPDVLVVGDLFSEVEIKDPRTRVGIGLTDIIESPSHDGIEGGLSRKPNMDLMTAGIGFAVLNTRGFSSTSPVRTLQIIDGVDNQSPGLNFSLGNFLGAPELDVLKVDVIQGASSAFYGPNAFNGVIDIRTKDPFLHPGLSGSVKFGERNLLKGELRYAHIFKNSNGLAKLAFKINGAYLRAHDWEATNLAPTFQSNTDETNPGGYDAVNVYGDEQISYLQDYTGEYERQIYPGLKIYSRRGYAETDLVDYNTENFKGNLGLYYNITPLIQLNGGFNFGSGTTVYQGENRFRLDDIFFWQGKIEVKQDDKFFVRAYITEEDAGKTYDIYNTALRLQTSAKLNNEWLEDYKNEWVRNYTSKVTELPGYPPWSIPFPYTTQDSVLEANRDKIIQWHLETQNFTNEASPGSLAFFEPGTARFDSMFNIITRNLSNDPENPGTRFYDKSGLFHVHGEYKIAKPFGEFTMGANFRQYNPDSKGTIFSDTMGVKITNREYGVYGGFDKKIIPSLLNLSVTVRLDKNENFDMVVSPAASLVYTVNPDNIFRLSFSSAIRNPTLADQYLYLDVGRALLLGNISGYKDLITPESWELWRKSETLDTSLLVYFNEDPIQPEKVKSIDVGYRGKLFERLWVDAGYYYSWYNDFIGYKIGIRAKFTGNLPQSIRVFRIASNAETQVTTQGFGVGANYLLGEHYNLSGNYSWNVLNKKGIDDPIIPAFNTPEHKFNIGITGRNLPIDLFGSRFKNLGFNINYKWIEGFIFEGSPQFTGPIPTYDLLDAQVNWTFERVGITLKLGASNVLNKKQFQTYGGPRVGRLAYFSVLYQSKS